MTKNVKVVDGLWVLKTAEGYKVGLTSDVQEELGNISFVSMPKLGQKIKKGEPFIELEAEKSVSDFNSPLSGTISVVNEAAEKNPSLLDDEEQTNAWIAIFTEIEESEQKEFDN